MFNHPVTQVLAKITKDNWLIALILIIGLAVLWRWEYLEKKRLEKAAERQKTRRIYHQKHVS